MTDIINDEIQELFQQLINAWNERDARGMADLFSEDGMQIGFDGSIAHGIEEIFRHLDPIFADHPTPPYIIKVKSVRKLSTETAILHAIAGMTPPGKSDIEPSINAHQTLVTVKQNGAWQIELFQTTPAQFHGRPELVQQMTDELREVLKKRGL